MNIFRKRFYITVSVIIFLSSGLSGCSSIMVHSEGFGHPFIGTTTSINNLPCNIVLSAFLIYLPVPLYIIDVPLSAAVDTVLLPADLLIEPEKERGDIDAAPNHCING